MEILVRDTFIEYPQDRSRQWGAVVVAEADGNKLRGQYPPVNGMPGAESATQALELANLDLHRVARGLGVGAATVAKIHAV